MTAGPKKYAFDTVFGDTGEIVSHPPPRPKVTFTSDDVATARREGENKGRESAEAEEARRMSAALEVIAAQITDINGNLAFECQRLERDCTRLAFETARRLTNHLFKDNPEEELTPIISECLSGLTGTPHITVQVNPNLHDGIAARIDDVASTAGFTGTVSIKQVADLKETQCQLIWQDGGADFDLDKRLEEIERMIADHLATREEDQLSLFPSA